MEEYLKTAILAVVEGTVTFHSRLVVKGSVEVTVDKDDPVHLTLDDVFSTNDVPTQNPDVDCKEMNVSEVNDGDLTASGAGLLGQMKQEVADPSSSTCKDEEPTGSSLDTSLTAVTFINNKQTDNDDVAHSTTPLRRSSRNVCSTRRNSSTIGKRKRSSHTPSTAKKVKADPDVDADLSTAAPHPEHCIDREKDGNNFDGDTALKLTIMKTSASSEHEEKLEKNERLTDMELLTMTSGDIVELDGMYKCAHCKFSDSKRFRVKNHLQVHGLATVLCHFCDQVFLDRAACKSHSDEVHSEERPSCKTCNKTFASLASLKIHLDNMHDFGGTGKRSCGYCTYTTNHYGNLLRHIRDAHGNDSLACLFCGKPFKGKFVLKSHIKDDHRDEKLTCCLCSKELRTPAVLTRHMRMEHSDQSQDSYKCDGCGFTAPSMKTLQRHMSSTEYSLQCYVCNTMTVCREQLRQHMQDKHPSQANKKRCNFCTKTFSSKNGLYSHKRIFHSGENDPEKRKTYTCHVCGKGFPIYDYLKRHIRSHDASYAPYECPKCGKKFKYHRNCKTHKEGCMNTDGYPCDMCGKVLKNEYCLREHIRNKHTNKKKDAYPCRKCGASFSYSGSRSKHEKVCATGKFLEGEEDLGDLDMEPVENYQEQAVQVLYKVVPEQSQLVKKEVYLQDEDKVHLELAEGCQKPIRLIEDIIIEHTGDTHTPIPVAYEEISSRLTEPSMSGITHVTLSEVPVMSDGTMSISEHEHLMSSMSAVTTMAVMTGSLDQLHSVIHMQ